MLFPLIWMVLGSFTGLHESNLLPPALLAGGLVHRELPARSALGRSLTGWLYYPDLVQDEVA